jgi:hypothetical protein
MPLAFLLAGTARKAQLGSMREVVAMRPRNFPGYE